jgi:thiamine-phosphate pyrophosphorylase
MPAANDLGGARRARLAAARLYLICDSRPAGGDIETFLRAALAGGVDVVQLRDKSSAGAELSEVAARAAVLCHELGALFLVNDDPYAAIAAGADGVHVGQDDMPVEEVRDLAGADLLIGLSTHSRAEVDTAAGRRADGGRIVDYIGVGPVFQTPTKPGRAAVGVELVRHAAATAGVPFFAIGGIDASNARQVLRAGARRIAVVRAIANAENPEGAARALRAELEQVAVEHANRAAAA